MAKYFGRMFIICLLFTVTGCIAFLFTAKMSDSAFVALALGIPAAFGLKDATLNFIHRNHPEAKDIHD